MEKTCDSNKAGMLQNMPMTQTRQDMEDREQHALVDLAKFKT